MQVQEDQVRKNSINNGLFYLIHISGLRVVGVESFQFGESSKSDKQIEPDIARRVKALKNIQLENVKHEIEYHQKIHKLDLQYKKIYDENNERRKKIYLGEYEPTDSECWWLDPNEDGGMETLDLEDMKIEDKIQLQNRGIPDFWLTVFKNANVTVLNRTVEMIDEPILRSLQDITVTMPEQNTGFSLHFHFAPNEFFTNSVLTKEYDLRNDFDRRDPLDYDGPEMLRARGCDIDWKPEMNPGVKITMKKQKLKGNQTGKGGTKTILKEERRDTFFSFFQPPPISMDTQRFDDDDELVAQLDTDFDIGLGIKDKLIPKAVLYYTGEARDPDSDED